ncbi:MAG: YbaK/EbsC family protein [Acidimicrobiia bacterium]|nr:YbaK/EbsC family protein [Acidimicrobiia bacterium]
MTEVMPAERDTRLSGVRYTPVRHPRVGSLDEAANLRGVDPGDIVKTMVVRRGDDDFVFVLVPGDAVIAWPKLRNLLGERRLSMPDADEARSVTGYVRGTITPFGALQPYPVVADTRIAGHVVSIGGGDHGCSLTMEGDDVVRILDAIVADVTKPMSG